MVKLKAISMHKIEDVPDDVLQEMQGFCAKLILHVKPLIDGTAPNVALAALNWMIPVMIKYLVTENPEELRKAARMSCIMLMKNMEILIENNCAQTDGGF